LADARSLVARALRASLTRLEFDADATVVVAFSGGQDSTCLLHALAHSRRRLKLIAVHVDHTLRPDSADSAARAATLATSIGVEAEIVRVDVGAYKKQRSLQQAARAARYEALATLVQKHTAAALLTAHTADDQAETLLLHLTRGAGLAGLAGMRLDEVLEVRRLGARVMENVPERLRLARPLLSVPRATTLAYCAQFGLAVVEDASNLSRAYTRNRVRLDLLPALERFNPAIRTGLTRLADLAAEDLDALNTIVEQLFAQFRLRQTEDEIELDLAGWRQQPRALQRRLLRHSLEQLLGQLEDVKARPIEDALELLRSGRRGQAYHLPYGIELCIDARHATLRLHGGAQPRRKLDITLGTEAPRV
jgi:tRNA(Ile)-lysidine synthetase-like protein